MAEQDLNRYVQNVVCRTGCKTKDHASYGDCLRDAHINIGDVRP